MKLYQTHPTLLIEIISGLAVSLLR